MNAFSIISKGILNFSVKQTILNKNTLLLNCNRNKFLILNIQSINHRFSHTTISSDKPGSKLSELNAKLTESLSSSSSIASKPRLVKKKSKKISNENTAMLTYKVKTIATADYYDLKALSQALVDSGAYKVLELGKLVQDTCLCVKPKYPLVNETEPRHMFFFEDGTTVFWNSSLEEQEIILGLLKKHQEGPHPSDSIIDEIEILDYSRIVLNKSSYIGIETTTTYYENNEQTQSFSNKHKLTKENGSTRFFNNHIYFSDYNDNEQEASSEQLVNSNETKHLLEKYAFSDAIALSVKLGIWEQYLADFCEKVEYITEDLKSGKKLNLKDDSVLKLLGELFTMRNFVNLQSNFLDTPDFYWNRDNLENLYSQLYANMLISKRTKLFNERLDHCIDLMNLLKENIADNKHTRLEWIIIGLITIEVLIAFGLLDMIKYFFIYWFDLGK